MGRGDGNEALLDVVKHPFALSDEDPYLTLEQAQQLYRRFIQFYPSQQHPLIAFLYNFNDQQRAAAAEILIFAQQLGYPLSEHKRLMSIDLDIFSDALDGQYRLLEDTHPQLLDNLSSQEYKKNMHYMLTAPYTGLDATSERVLRLHQLSLAEKLRPLLKEQASAYQFASQQLDQYLAVAANPNTELGESAQMRGGNLALFAGLLVAEITDVNHPRIKKSFDLVSSTYSAQIEPPTIILGDELWMAYCGAASDGIGCMGVYDQHLNAVLLDKTVHKHRPEQEQALITHELIHWAQEADGREDSQLSVAQFWANTERAEQIRAQYNATSEVRCYEGLTELATQYLLNGSDFDRLEMEVYHGEVGTLIGAQKALGKSDQWMIQAAQSVRNGHDLLERGLLTDQQFTPAQDRGKIPYVRGRMRQIFTHSAERIDKTSKLYQKHPHEQQVEALEECLEDIEHNAETRVRALLEDIGSKSAWQISHGGWRTDEQLNLR